MEESFLDKLLRTRYPLTYYLSRQQHFTKHYSAVQTTAVPTTPEPSLLPINKRKVSLAPPACFNVPDTLDFNGTAYERNDDVDHSIEMDNIGTQEYDETLLLKSNNSRYNESNCDLTSKINSSIINRTSAIHLEFSPYEHSSPLNQAIQNGLNLMNK